MKSSYVLVGEPGEKRLKRKIDDGLVSDSTCDEINGMLEHKLVGEEGVNDWISGVPLISDVESYVGAKNKLAQDTKYQH